ncbi:carbohydrate porin [Shewanella sp. SG44-2]|uniref:carbohydrate porin n=1 Tax=Shewanella sp. SG44-2 TaxID=2760962 RepID=UPI0015FF4D76|nr:carbohydrate porin [Shewanella sp. SG44-2]MBB1428646.1 carbohydrate porin [Shewanella sp. SG44-2]
MKSINSLTTASVLLLICSSSVQADNFSADNYLFGDIGGIRSKIHNAGIDVSLGYTFETGGNLTGGQHHATSYADQTVLGVNFDLEKLLDLSDANFHFALTNRGGQSQNINDKAEIGQLMQSIEVFGRGRVTRISEFYYEQKLLSDDLNIKLGRMNVGAEFGAFQCEFAYLGFCGSQFGNVNSTVYNWPISQWAGVVKYHLAPEWYVKTGVYQMNPSWLKNSQNLNLGSPHGTLGMTIPVELAWMPNLNYLPGTYKLGYWHDTVGGDDLYYNQDGNPLMIDGGKARHHDSKDGAYFVAEQQVTAVDGDSARGLSVFLMGTLNDQDITTVDKSLALGVSYQGPFAARPTDKWGLAAKYLHVNDSLADSAQLYNDNNALYTPIQETETVVASYYKFQVTKYSAIRPEIQYIHNPGGISENNDAWVVTLKGDIAF